MVPLWQDGPFSNLQNTSPNHVNIQSYVACYTKWNTEAIASLTKIQAGPSTLVHTMQQLWITGWSVHTHRKQINEPKLCSAEIKLVVWVLQSGKTYRNTCNSVRKDYFKYDFSNLSWKFEANFHLDLLLPLFLLFLLLCIHTLSRRMINSCMLSAQIPSNIK